MTNIKNKFISNLAKKGAAEGAGSASKAVGKAATKRKVVGAATTAAAGGMALGVVAADPINSLKNAINNFVSIYGESGPTAPDGLSGGGFGSVGVPADAVVADNPLIEPNPVPDYTTIQEQQSETPEIHEYRQQEFVESELKSIPANWETPVDENYTVDSIKSWLSRKHLFRKITYTAGDDHADVTAYDRGLLELVAQGKLDFFKYFRGDLTVSMRWNVPKTTFGAFAIIGAHGDVDIDWDNTDEDTYQTPVCKTLCDLSGSGVDFDFPWFYPLPYVDLSADTLSSWNIGHIWIKWLAAPTSVTDFLPTIRIACYASFKNVSVMTPMPKHTMPQGAAISMLGELMGVGLNALGQAASDASAVVNGEPRYQPMGQSVVRVWNEGINLMRQEGLDPAPSAARVAFPLRAKVDDTAVVDYNQLINIPSYYVIRPGAGYSRRLPMFNFWLNLIAKNHVYMRCDFIVRCHCIATPFHSGRARIVYLPTNEPVSLAVPIFHSQGESIIWDIKENAHIEFTVPYGSNLEYNDPPLVTFLEETPFATPFTSVIPPYFLVEIVATNLRVMGYFGVDTPSAVVSNPRWNVPIPRSVPGPWIMAQGMETMGFFHPVHTSDDDGNTSIVTSARRPAQFWYTDSSGVTPTELWTGPRTVIPEKILCNNWPWEGYVGNYMQYFAGYRGSVKISVALQTVPDSDPHLNLKPRFGSVGTANATDGVQSVGNFGEIIIPYMTPYLFHGCSPEACCEVYIDVAPTTTYYVYLSFLDDFELLMPTVKCTPALFPSRRKGQLSAIGLGGESPLSGQMVEEE